MKIIIKNLKQVVYNVEIESGKKTIKDLKEEIQKAHGFDANLMKLLHNGVVLDNSKTLESYNIKDENVVIMMNSKPKQKPNPNPTQSTIDSQSKPVPQQEKSKEENNQNTQKINSLVEMGYEKEKVEKALNASGGNIDMAIEFLSTGNIPERPPQVQTNTNIGNTTNNNNSNANNSNLDDELKKNASILKILCHRNPNKIFSLMNNIKIKSPALLDKIKQHEEEFKNLLVSPITQEDLNNFNAVHQGLLNRVGRRGPTINLTREEAEAIKRLENLGNFSHAEVIQAYIACDKNEELTANYLFEQKLRDEQEANKNQNNNNNQG